MLIRCEMLKKLANAFIEVAKEENLPVNITMGRSYTDSGGSRQVGIIVEFDSREALDAWILDEPFLKHGIYASIEIKPFNKAFPKG